MKNTYFQLVRKLAGVAAIASSTFLIGVPALAQFIYFPASYFSPRASLYESEDNLNVADLLAMNNDFKEITTNLNKTGLTETLKQEGVTFFAPTDSAFKALPIKTREKLADPDNLAKVLKYHIVVGQITNEDIKRKQVDTLLGSPVQIVGVSVDNKPQLKLNDATASDPLSAQNGVVVPIDRVLLPPDL